MKKNHRIAAETCINIVTTVVFLSIVLVSVRISGESEGPINWKTIAPGLDLKVLVAKNPSNIGDSRIVVWQTLRPTCNIPIDRLVNAIGGIGEFLWMDLVAVTFGVLAM